MKLGQRQLRSLIENIFKEAGPDRTRIDQEVGSESVSMSGQELALGLAGQILNDESLKLIDKCTALVSKELSGAGVGGANVPSLDGEDLRDILGEEMIEMGQRELESSIAQAIQEFISQLANSMAAAMSDHSSERNVRDADFPWQTDDYNH